MHRLLVCLCLTTACNDRDLYGISLTRSTEWVAGRRVVQGPAKVDVLLVVDDSPSMHDQAGLLAENLRAIAAVYEDEWIDYRIGVVTTDHSGPDCAPGRDGALVRTSCRERLPSFVISANEESPAVDVRDVCTDSCALEGMGIRPTSVVGQDGARPRGWLERGAMGQNTADPLASLACLGQVGLGGCTAESPLGAVLHFLDRAADPQDPDFGFVRADAGLAIVLIGDEDDCSRSSSASLRGDGSLSAGCWRAGSDCVQGDAGLSCEAATGPDLVDVDRFVERLLSIDADKRWGAGDEQRVFVSAVAGVPFGYPERPQIFNSGDDPAFERAFGIGAGCVQGEFTAAPSVRTVAVAEAFTPWQDNVVSACGSDWRRALACLPGARWDQSRSFCLEVELLGDDPELADSCMLMETRAGERQRLPECSEDPDERSFALPDGVDACVGWRTQGLSEACLELGLGAEAIIVRPEPSWDALEYEVTCATEF